MRFAVLLVLLVPGSSVAAQLPITHPPTTTSPKQLTFQNFDALGASTIGLAHYSTEPDAYSFTEFPANSTVGLTTFNGLIVVEVKEGFPLWDITSPPLLLPFWGSAAWQQLGRADAITLRLADWTLDRDVLIVRLEGTDGVTTLAATYGLLVKMVPEPSGVVLALVAGVFFRRRISISTKFRSD